MEEEFIGPEIEDPEELKESLMELVKTIALKAQDLDLDLSDIWEKFPQAECFDDLLSLINQALQRIIAKIG